MSIQTSAGTSPPSTSEQAQIAALRARLERLEANDRRHRARGRPLWAVGSAGLVIAGALVAVESASQDEPDATEGLVTFVAGEKISSSEVNANFSQLQSGLAELAAQWPPGTRLLRSSIPLLGSHTVVETDFAKVGPDGLCLQCASSGVQEPVPNAERVFQLVFTYSDSIGDCSDPSLNGSDWRLVLFSGDAEAELPVLAEWGLERTWSGTALYHSQTTPDISPEVIAACTSTWGEGTCQLQGKLNSGCSDGGHALQLQSATLQVYDILQ